MAAAGASGAEVDEALGALSVRFDEGRAADASWRLGCDVQKAVDASSSWCRTHDLALLQALLALSALGGLPSDAQTAKSAAAWEAAEAALHAVQKGLAHVGPALPALHSRALEAAHACRPGYDVSGCKQVRLVQRRATRTCARGARRRDTLRRGPCASHRRDPPTVACTFARQCRAC
jgi:hypothetical protein